MSIPMQMYKNHTNGLIEFEIGNRPGSAPNVYRVEPGGSCSGPVGYAKAFVRQGLKVVPASISRDGRIVQKSAAETEIARLMSELERANAGTRQLQTDLDDAQKTRDQLRDVRAQLEKANETNKSLREKLTEVNPEPPAAEKPQESLALGLDSESEKPVASKPGKGKGKSKG